MVVVFATVARLFIHAYVHPYIFSRCSGAFVGECDDFKRKMSSRFDLHLASLKCLLHLFFVITLLSVCKIFYSLPG